MATNDVVRARNALAGLFSFGNTPAPEVEAEARIRLAAAKLDRAMREAAATAPPLDATYAAHLVGLLLSSGGSDDQAVGRLTRCIREAIYVTPVLTDADRVALAQLVLGGDR